ncbi:SIR2 family protein, partial [Aeromonas veronii]
LSRKGVNGRVVKAGPNLTICSRSCPGDDGEQKNDIELLLSLCDSYLTLKCLSSADQECVEAFLKAAKVAILEHTNFVDRVATDGWTAHNTFVGVLGRRSPKQKRLKLFTTNYDLAFEMAASNTGMIVIDGFEFSNPSRFNPAWFHYDIVNRSQATEKGGAYLPNIVHLYKIHGSVDWVRTSQGVQKRSALNTTEGEPVFIYPSSSKYQSSYDSPYLDMMAAFLDALQKPKTALLCVGFGFNDKHINSAITMALRTNPELMVMAATKDPFSVNGSFNSAIRSQLMNVIKAGDSRVAIADCTFDVFASLLPNRHKPTPEESLLKAFELVVQRGGAV